MPCTLDMIYRLKIDNFVTYLWSRIYLIKEYTSHLHTQGLGSPNLKIPMINGEKISDFEWLQKCPKLKQQWLQKCPKFSCFCD